MHLYWQYISTTHRLYPLSIVNRLNNINPGQNINFESNIWTPYIKLIIRHHNCLSWSVFVAAGTNPYNTSSTGTIREVVASYDLISTRSAVWMPSITLIEKFYSSLLSFLMKIGLLHLVVNFISWCLQDFPSIGRFQTSIHASAFLHLIWGSVLSDFYCPSVIFWPCFPSSFLVDQTPQ